MENSPARCLNDDNDNDGSDEAVYDDDDDDYVDNRNYESIYVIIRGSNDFAMGW